jgi:SnoaL-like domain
VAAESDAYIAIERLQRAYADIATRSAWDEVPHLLTPDAHITFDTRSGAPMEIHGSVQFGEFGAKMQGVFGFYEYIPLNFVVSFETGGTAKGRTYSLEVAEAAKSGEWMEFYGTYDDEYALHEGSWRFSRRHYRTYGRRTSGRLEAYPLPWQRP